MPKYNRIAGVSFGDRHAGLKNGLIMPGTKLTYGVGENAEEVTFGEDVISDWSKWLWHDVWMPGIEKAIEWAGADPLIAADSGDAVHGHRFVEHLYSASINHQVDISIQSMIPLRKAPTLCHYLLAFGTGAHDYGHNSAAISIAEKLAAWGWKAKADEHISFILPDHFIFDLGHHGPNVSLKPHLRQNGARVYVEDRIRANTEYGERYPGLFQRGHVHNPISVPVSLKLGLDYHKSHIIVTPPLCGPNGYARQFTKSLDFIECGMFFWELIDGKLGDVISFSVKKDSRTVYKMPNEGVVFFNNMVEDGGHKHGPTASKKKKGKKKK